MARLTQPMRGSSGRHTIARIVLADDPERTDCLIARSSGGQDSYMLGSLAKANGMIFIPPDADLATGDEVLAWELRARDA
jgi:molybdopterin biosynthesis enzyme